VDGRALDCEIAIAAETQLRMKTTLITNSRRAARKGFTLIELLVVIAIQANVGCVGTMPLGVLASDSKNDIPCLSDVTTVAKGGPLRAVLEPNTT